MSENIPSQVGIAVMRLRYWRVSARHFIELMHISALVDFHDWNTSFGWLREVYGGIYGERCHLPFNNVIDSLICGNFCICIWRWKLNDCNLLSIRCAFVFITFVCMSVGYCSIVVANTISYWSEQTCYVLELYFVWFILSSIFILSLLVLLLWSYDDFYASYVGWFIFTILVFIRLLTSNLMQEYHRLWWRIESELENYFHSLIPCCPFANIALFPLPQKPYLPASKNAFVLRKLF